MILRHHSMGADRTPEFTCLAGIAGVIGNTILGDYNTYEKSEEADYILRRPQMITYFDQSTRTHKLPMKNVIVQAMNLSKNYLTDLLTKSEGAFRERVSTALSYLTIAARQIFDHIPTSTEQRTLPPTTPFFINHVMKHQGTTSRNSIIRQTLTILGKDNIINIDDLKPSPNNHPFPTALYALNLLQAGGKNKWYYRNREGTEETVNKSAFIMATGQSSMLDCTEDPAKYGIILRASDRAQTCMEFQPCPSDQNHWPSEQRQVWPLDQNTQLMITHQPVSVIKLTRPIAHTKTYLESSVLPSSNINKPIKEEFPTTSTSSETPNKTPPTKKETSTSSETYTTTSTIKDKPLPTPTHHPPTPPPPSPPPENYSVIRHTQYSHPPPRVHFQEGEYSHPPPHPHPPPRST